jgi:hypothetical protein
MLLMIRGRKILWKKGSVGPKKIGGQEQIAGSLTILITMDPNGEVEEIGDPEWRGENSLKHAERIKR